MQHNVDGRRKNKRYVVRNIQPHSYHDRHLQQPTASAPLLSRLRNFNNLALTSIGTFFSGPTILKSTAHLHQDEAEFSGCGTVVSCRNGLNADATRDSGCFWHEHSQNCLSSPANDDLTPVGNGFYSSEVDDYCSIKQLPSSCGLGTHDSLDSSLADSKAFPADAGDLIKNDLPPVQRACSSYAHTLPYRSRPDVRHLFGDSRRSDTLDENDIRGIYISAEHSSQNPLQSKSAATPERATNTILCATAPVFVPSPAARALLFRNQSSFQPNATRPDDDDTASVHTETPTLTPDSSATGFLSPASFSTSFEHVIPSYAACTLDSSDGMPGGFRVEDNDNDKILYTSPQLLEVKEGKKREQLPAQQTSCDASLRPMPIVASAPVLDDPDEWYGLEYTLELSSRESQPSGTRSFSAGGEHSKSRESWAAIHRGTIHPFLEDEDYYQWKNWHRQLDKQDERRKHRKGFAFKAHSKELSYLFVDEMKTRAVFYWQKGTYGIVAREVKERLNYITAHCPDPYFPPKKHDLGWYLKRSRSVGCIRELKALEDGTRADIMIAAGTLERKET